jgi:hyperosmotically inducible periplasmic protein
MKASRFICAAIAAATLLSIPAFAQTTDDATAMQAAPTGKKAMRAEDRALARAVRRSMSKTKGLQSSKITVLAKGGAVTLAGTVPDSSQIPLAESAAQGTAGVKSVSNRLSIKEPGGGN